VNATEKIHEMKNKVNAEELECNYCRANLHISWIKLENDEDESEDENNIYCLKHALKYLNDNRIQASRCKLMFTYTSDEIDKLIKKLRNKIQTENDGNAGHSSGTTHKGKTNQKGRN
jgi:protein Jumonji